MKKNFWKKRRVLITGAGGFLGSHFLAGLKDNGVYVIGSDLKASRQKNIIKLDILDEKKLASFCKKEKINIIIHCAALDGNAYFKKDNSARIITENIKMVANILQVAQEQPIKELVIFSSAEIYAYNTKSPLKEIDDYAKYPPLFNNSYATSKILIEMMANLYAQEFDLKILLPRPTNIYGPGDKIATESDRVIPSMISKVLSGQAIEIWGNGQQIRGFIYITDLVTAVLRLIESQNFSTINMAASESISIKNLAELITKLAGQKINIKFSQAKLSGVKKRIIDISKLNSLIAFKPISLANGLKKTINYYQKNGC